MAGFNKRFRRADSGGNVAGGGRATQAPPPPPPEAGTEARPSTAAPAPDAARARQRAEARPSTAAPAPDAARARQRAEFGGFHWGAAFFGWLVAVGLGALLTAAVVAAGTAVGLTDVTSGQAQRNVDTIGIGGGIALLVIAIVAYYSGGYVAGRMSRFDGARQGFGVWAFGLVVTVAIAAAGWIFGDKYNVLDQLNLPRIPANPGDLTRGGLIALAAIAVGTLIAAIAGGKVGQRYHAKVDRAALPERMR
jgi:hypothetical protein